MPLPIWEILGLMILGGGTAGFIAWAAMTLALRRLPGYTHVDKKTRDTERYLERVKQGMRDK